MIMKKYCDDWRILWWLKNIVKENGNENGNGYGNENGNENGNVSSMVNEVMRTIFFFLRKNFISTKSTKSIKRHI